MKSRLGFAVAVHVDPEILILDEVLAVGDLLFKRKCYAKMEEFFNGNKTIIYVSHDTNSVTQLCSRAIFIDEGKIILDGDAKTVTTYYQKYLFATKENKSKVRDDIKKKSIALEGSKNDVNNLAQDVKIEEKSESFFLDNFIPKSKVEYKNYDVEIIDPHIETTSGKRVNVLMHGENYKYKYKVKYKRLLSVIM